MGRKVAVIKYIHGWLATGTRNFYTRRQPDQRCELCGFTDNREHLFFCANAHLAQMRELRITKLLTDLGKNTDSGFHQVFTAGVKAALKLEDLSQSTIEDWPGYLQRAYATQELIGWNQVLYGRIGVHWEEIAHTSVDQCKTVDTFSWTSKAIRLLWDFGLAV